VREYISGGGLRQTDAMFSGNISIYDDEELISVAVKLVIDKYWYFYVA